MEDLRSMHKATANNPLNHGNEREEWEDWTDDERRTALSEKRLSSKIYRRTTNRSSKPRQSNSKLQRVRSRKRQQAQNAKAGIRLVTDMTRFKKGPHHVAQLVKPAPDPYASQETAAKFVDANALRALEGSPSSASMGNWAWLKNSPSSATTATPKGPTTATPDGSKIVIGFSFPEDDMTRRDISPQTAVVATPMDRLAVNQPSTNPFYNQHAKSAWSPDTEDGLSPSQHLSIASGIYSQSYGFPNISAAPPVPAVPAPFKNPIKARLSKNDVDDDDNFTPVTLFEEDGHKSPASAASKISPGTTQSRSGWWDHIKTPFKEHFSPTSQADNEASTPSADDWWKDRDEKKTLQVPQSRNEASSHVAPSSAMLRPPPFPVPVIRQPTPPIASSSRSPPSMPDNQHETHSEKSRVMMEENDSPTELPPPYEQAQAVKIRPIFPPEHPFASQFPASPQPSPGLDGCMTSQGGIKMIDVPLTPTVPLPDRPVGTFVAHEQLPNVQGNAPAAKVERTRRRHEKEEYYARRAGGFWKGRACFDGCYGRSGREGRQRRRVWLWVCLAILLLLVVLGVVLGIELTRRFTDATHDKASDSSSGSSPASASASTSASAGSESVWLNLANFPPIPTGLATVVAPDNSEAVDGCVSPPTLWSCSLPPEQQAANKPADANQPEFILQIQYDNSTRQLWDIPNGTPPTPSVSADTATSTKATSTTHTSTKGTTTTDTLSSASAKSTDDSDGGSLTSPSNNELFVESDSTLERRATSLYDTGIAPSPAPPSFNEMWFLGNTTDGIVSDEKAGEPTPFYISFFKNVSSSAGPNMLPATDASKSKRGTGNGIGSGTTGSDSLTQYLPAPLLNEDGTGAAAQLRPYPFQQPLRLYDRGLPTEHYGFYVYFNKTIYLESLDNETASFESDGGSRETNANWLVNWQQTRFIVKIWTQKGNSTRLMGGATPATDVSATTMPGTFPYPITIGEDTHGGDVDLKTSFAYGVEADQHINTTSATLITNNIGYGSQVINPRLPAGDLSYGGIDGGTGGCKCEWVNWVNNDGSTDESLA
ncbi:hypothetical protein VMCG_01099 [Cytospora schulzeri]|uniref:Uncharacterized protein n=1 Tax=Cytospora schulzeri TaxID=448051 RepID=A0A423X4Y4_9PEZI|nr:hypothetical protein VMCG_01099 [Valsa malicola]